MKFKKIFFLLCIIICLFSIAGACAGDADDMAIQTSNSTLDDVITLEEADNQDNKDAISSDEPNGPYMMDNSDEKEGSDPGSFTLLQEYISGATEGSTISLHTDYSVKYGGNTIEISKKITIDGNNHVLSGNNKKGIFNIAADGKSIVLMNIIFENGETSDKGAAILNTHSSTTLTLINCEFRNNHAGWYGGAVYSEGNTAIITSKFQSNHAVVEGGAIYCKGKLTIEQTEFNNNKAAGAIAHECYGGAISSYGKCEIDSCIFNGNHAGTGSILVGLGGAIYAKDDLMIYNDMSYGQDKIMFMGNNANNEGGAIYACKDLYINWNSKSYTAIFTDNTADINGGAIHCKGQTHINNSEYNDNKVKGRLSFTAFGGAILSDGICEINLCTFNGNSAVSPTEEDCGGAIYAGARLTVDYSNFYNNNVKVKGGAIYCKEQSRINHTGFLSNIAAGATLRECYGGAILSMGDSIIDSCYFYNNQVGSHTTGSGGAIYANDILSVYNSTFDKNYAEKNSYAIHCEKSSTLKNSTFTNHIMKSDDGIYMRDVVYSKGTCYIDSCKFDNNGGDPYATLHTDENVVIKGFTSFTNNEGHQCGAIWAHLNVLININAKEGEALCEFNSNHAVGDTRTLGLGGAIYCQGYVYANFVKASNNSLVSVSCTDGGGGVIYCKGAARIANSEFYNNTLKIVSKDGGRKDIEAMNPAGGGAIRSGDLCYIDSCIFNGNNAESGGAIWAGGDLTITGENTFTNNTLKTWLIPMYSPAGGAIYCKGNLLINGTNTLFSSNYGGANGGAIFCEKTCKIYNCKFDNNYVKDVIGSAWTKIPSYQGGAIYSKGTTTIENCCFENNYAQDHGGAVYIDNEIIIINNRFVNNSAKEGGAIHAKTLAQQASNSAFLKNNATEKGGAVYISHKCNPQFVSCRFEENTCNNWGGAVYINNLYCYLSVSYCTFVDNKAANNKGQSVFITGHYNSVDMCWFGTNKPEFKDQFKIQGHPNQEDEDYTITNYLKIAMKINETELFAGNDYRTTVYLYATNGANLTKDLLHSTGIFYGDGQFSNVKADVNNMTADVNFTHNGTPMIYGKLDHQVVSLSNDVKNKYPSEVHILSCEDIKYPNAVKVTYKIINMSSDVSYVVKNSQGITVDRGKVNSPDTWYVKGLKPGAYSITIINHETLTHSSSSNNKTFNVLRGDIGELRIVVHNETYGEDVECIVYASVDGEYNLTLAGASNMVTVVGRVGHFNRGILDANSYEAWISFAGNELYEPFTNSTRFVVDKAITPFEIDTVPEEIAYGDNATVTHKLINGATGNITYYLSDGTFLGKLPVSKNLTLPVLDAGHYVIIANYSGDIDYKSALDSAHIIVNKAKLAFEVKLNASEITYGETATLTHKLSSNTTGTIKYYLSNGTFIAELPVHENLTLPVLDAGLYIIIAKYTGDRNFVNATANATLTINQVKTVLKVEINAISYGETATITHILPNGVTGTIEYYLNDDLFLWELPVSENLALHAWDAGSYIITAKYTGDRNFVNATANATLIINKAKTKIIADALTTVYNSGENIVIALKDTNDNPVIDVNVTVDFNGIKNYTTDKNGKIYVSTNNLAAKTYGIVISFNGTDNYGNSSKVTKVVINKRPSKLTTTPLTTIYQVHKYLVINLKDDLGNPIRNVDTYIKINGVTYKCKTDAKGNARLIIRLDAKTYKAKVTFSNPNYTSATAYVKVTVLKAKPKITAKKKTFKVKKIIKRYTVKLTVHGKALAKVKVTLKIKGKTYKATTNAKGKATFKIKKLTQKGKYIAIIKYKGNYLYKKATKKVKIVIK